MNQKIGSLLGIIGPTIGYVALGASIAFSPWFSWESHALSDLGHAVKSDVAAIFNFGLLFAGLLILIYAVTLFRKHAPYTSFFLATAGFSLQLVATYDEVYEPLHAVVSILFFASLGFASLVYAAETKSYLAVAAFLIGGASWALYGARIYSVGVAVPEIISLVVVTIWIMYSAVKLYRGK
jgi:hypothetical membrane protein